MIKAMVFDFDGLIFDTETFMFQSMRQVFLNHKLNLTLDDWCNKCISDPDNYDAYRYFQKCLDKPISRDEIAKSHEMEYVKLVEGKKARAGVEEYLKRCKQLGIKTGLATNNSREWVDLHLKKLNLASYFDYICTIEDVQKPKPDAEPYLKVLGELNVEPDNAIAFEDSPEGVKSAKSAKMYCVLVPNEITKRLEFTVNDIDLFLESMSDMDLDSVIDHILNK